MKKVLFFALFFSVAFVSFAGQNFDLKACDNGYSVYVISKTGVGCEFNLLNNYITKENTLRSPITISLFSTDGQLVYTHKTTELTVILPENIKKGMYYVTLRIGLHQETQKWNY